MRIKITADSTCDLSEELLAQWDIALMPMHILMGEDSYLDGVTIHPADVFAYVNAGGKMPKSAAANLVEYTDFFEPFAKECDAVIHISVSSKLSSCFQNAKLAAGEFENVYVVDSQTAAIGTGILAEYALSCVDAGMPADEIAAQLEQKREDVCLVALLDTLEYLQKGGRIGKVTAMAGTMLQIKPIITFAPDGQLQSVAKVRGRHQVMRKLVDMAVDRCGEHKRYNLAVAHGGAPEEMETVRQMLTEALPNSDHLWDGEIDGTLSVYIGDGVLGAAVQVLD